MTFREKLKQEHPECVGVAFPGGCSGCPSKYGYEGSKKEGLCGGDNYKTDSATCRKCWNREMPEPKNEPEPEPKKDAPKKSVEELLEEHWSQEYTKPQPKEVYVSTISTATPKKTTGAILLGCARTIAYECKKNINCDGCVFSDNEKACIFADDNNPIFPENWMVPLATLEEVERGEESDG